MPIVNAIIFDLDGVIVHTDEYHYLAWKIIADRLGIPFNREMNNRLRGISRMQSLEIILSKGNLKLNNKEKIALTEEKNEYYCEYLDKMTGDDCSEEVRATLRALQSAGIKLAIGSSSKNAKTILSKTGLNSYFDAVSDGTNITHTKPNPEVFLYAAKLLGELPEHCVVVEDAVSGIEAGYNAGMRTIAMGNAKTSRLCTWSIERFGDILHWMKIRSTL